LENGTTVSTSCQTTLQKIVRNCERDDNNTCRSRFIEAA
jgi:hypothetical protein